MELVEDSTRGRSLWSWLRTAHGDEGKIVDYSVFLACAIIRRNGGGGGGGALMIAKARISKWRTTFPSYFV